MAYFITVILISSLLGLCHGRIDGELMEALSSFGRSDVLINFNGDNSEAVRSIAQRRFGSRLSKVKALSSALQSLSTKDQGPIQKFLQGKGIQSQTFWSSNQMVIKNANLPLLQGVDAFSQVSRIQTLPKVQLSPVTQSENSPKANSTVEWGVKMIGADQVWSTFKTEGEGVVVANIDTGVRGTHEALAGNWRKDHGWYDPYTNTTTPDDGNGHGTHTMGTIAGKGGIGVAPGATWIACRGCNSDSCDSSQLLACGQFMLSPTNPDGSDPQPSLIPDIVSNSWGGRGGSDWYTPTINAWTEAGIMHSFAIGNSGPFCRTGGSPGDQPGVFSVGSTDKDDQLSLFSSKGPAGGFFRRYVKPDIAAPGSDVRSAWYDEDDSYNTISGTSMACPHVAGVMALMLSAHRNKVADESARLTQEAVQDDIEKTAVTQGLSLSTLNFRCDGLFAPRDRYPNNQFGHGRINALTAVNATVSG